MDHSTSFLPSGGLERNYLKEKLDSLRLIDDIFFVACLRDNPRAAEVIIRVALDMPNCTVTEVSVQHDVSFPRNKGVRLDLKVRGENGEIFDVEVQKKREKDLIKRSIYYQSALLVESLPHGATYDELGKAYVLFLCEKDPFGKGKACYTLRYVNDEKIPIDEVGFIRFFNCDYKGKDPYGSLANDMLSRKEDKILDPVLRDTFRKGKIGERSNELMSDLAEELMAIGEKKGAEKAKNDHVVALLSRGMLSIGDIASAFGLTVEEVEAIWKEAQEAKSA